MPASEGIVPVLFDAMWMRLRDVGAESDRTHVLRGRRETGPRLPGPTLGVEETVRWLTARLER